MPKSKNQEADLNDLRVIADENYSEADEPTAIARELIQKHHPHLAEARIVCLFELADEPKTKNGKIVLASARKATGMLACFSQRDFILTFHGKSWEELTSETKRALVMHELCHCDREDGKWATKGHDLEEFGAVVEKFGLWHRGLQNMAAVIQEEFKFTDGKPVARENPETAKAA